MKTYRLLYSVAVVFFTALSVQAQFQKLDLPEDVMYNDVYFSTPSTGFILGTKGTFLKTTDTGATWYKIEMDTAMFFLKAHFPTPQVGYIMAGTTAEPQVLKTKDGGNSWAVINTAIRGAGIYFTNADTGFIYNLVTLWKTTDGGQTWKMSNPFGDVNDIAFPTSDTGYAVGGASLQKTTDGGKTWVSIKHPLVKTSMIYSCSFRNADTGMIFGNYSSLLAKTYDGGKNWISEIISHHLQDEPSTYVRGLWGSHFPSELIGYAVGAEATLYKTLDGGEKWKGIRFDTSIGNAFQKVHFANEKTGFMISFDGKEIVKISKGGDPTVGVNENVKNISPKEFLSYPQPAHITFTIKLSPGFNISQCRVYDMKGRMINNYFSFMFNEDQIIVHNISAPPGKYFYILYDEMNHTASNGSFIITP